MSKLLAGGLVAVLLAEVIGVLLGWRWALPIGGLAVALFAVQVTRQMALAKLRGAAGPPPNDALESLQRWKTQTQDLIRWADGTRGDWDRYLRPKLARDFLVATNQKEPAAVVATGRMIFGDELWDWVNPDNVVSARRDEPGPGRDALENILRRLEHP